MSFNAANAKNANTLVLYSHQPSNVPSYQFLHRVYSELFSRIGFNIAIEHMPSARASSQAEQGIIDGQFGRIYQYQELYPNQIRVNVPVYTMTLMAFAHQQQNIRLENNWQSFKNQTYRVSYQRGMIISEQNLKKYVRPDLLHSITDIEQGFLKLRHQRTDIFIYSSSGSYPYLLQPTLANTIKPVGVMERKNVFLYLHKKHQSLVPQLTQALKAMRADGTIKQYCLQAFSIDSKLICQKLLTTEEDTL